MYAPISELPISLPRSVAEKLKARVKAFSAQQQDIVLARDSHPSGAEYTNSRLMMKMALFKASYDFTRSELFPWTTVAASVTM